MPWLPYMPILCHVRYDFAPLSHMFNEMHSGSDTLSYSISSPTFDVKEEKEAYVLEGHILGFEPEDIMVEFSDDQNMTIRGRIEHRREEGPPVVGAREIEASITDIRAVVSPVSSAIGQLAPKRNYCFSERSSREFVRGFTFPTGIDQELVKASLEHGILSVVLPKRVHQRLNSQSGAE